MDLPFAILSENYRILNQFIDIYPVYFNTFCEKYHEKDIRKDRNISIDR